MLIHHGFQTKRHGNDITVQHTDEDPIYCDNYDSEALQEILDAQHLKNWIHQEENFKILFQILIISDEFADDPSFARQSNILHSLYVRGVITWCVKGERLVRYESERCDDYDAVGPVSLLTEEARPVMINSKGPCDK